MAQEDLYDFFRFLDESQRQQTSGQKHGEEQEMRELSGLVAALDHSKAWLKFGFAISSLPPPSP